MKTFVIYNRNTGEILQTHVQTDDLHDDAETLLQTVRPGAQGEDIDVMAVDALAPGTRYRVDVKAKQLVTVEGSEAAGAGGAFVQQVGGDPRIARTVIIQLRQRQP
jgi:hypothetical protein